MGNKKVRDFVYYSAKLRGLSDNDAVALAKHLANWLAPKRLQSKTNDGGSHETI